LLAAFALFGCVSSALSQELTASDENAPSFTVQDLKPGHDLRILVYGDMRFTNPANTTDTWPLVRKWLAQKVADEKPDAMLVSGDIPFHGSDPADWKVFQQEASSWSANHLRVYPAIGNHEVIPDPQAGLANYFAAFPQLNGYHAYSVLMGNVYVLTLNTSEPIWPKGYQADWLKAQLDHIPPQVDFIFVLLHIPLIADTQSEFLANIPSPDLLQLREYLEGRAATMRQKMIVVSGHIHNYERFEQKGITHVISGGGGAKPYPVYLPGPEDLYQDKAFPNFNYVIFTIQGAHADATMYRVADPSAAKLSVQVKDRFSVDAKPEDGSKQKGSPR
jgi:hypothetical protein